MTLVHIQTKRKRGTRRREISAMKKKRRDTKASSSWGLTIEISSRCATLIALYFEIKELVNLDLSHHIFMSNTSPDSCRDFLAFDVFYLYQFRIRHFSLFSYKKRWRKCYSLRILEGVIYAYLVNFCREFIFRC